MWPSQRSLGCRQCCRQCCRQVSRVMKLQNASETISNSPASCQITFNSSFLIKDSIGFLARRVTHSRTASRRSGVSVSVSVTKRVMFFHVSSDLKDSNKSWCGILFFQVSSSWCGLLKHNIPQPRLRDVASLVGDRPGPPLGRDVWAVLVLMVAQRKQ